MVNLLVLVLSNKTISKITAFLCRNGAKVIVKPNGDVSVEGDRDVYVSAGRNV